MGSRLQNVAGGLGGNFYTQHFVWQSPGDAGTVKYSGTAGRVAARPTRLPGRIPPGLWPPDVA